MSRHHWLIFLALVGLTSCRLPPWQHASEEQEQRAKSIQQALERISVVLGEQSKPDVTTQPCDIGQDNRSSDLCAQWKAADAGKDSAKAAWLFGTIGSVIGGLTLMAAYYAARYAKRAAIAAEKTIEETRRIGEAQTRAYMSFHALSQNIDIDHLGSPTGNVNVFAIIRNSGATPATCISMHSTVIYMKNIDSEFFPEVIFIDEIDFNFVRGADEFVTLRTSSIPFDKIDSAVNGEISIYMFNYIRYRDVFSNDGSGHEFLDCMQLVPHLRTSEYGKFMESKRPFVAFEHFSQAKFQVTLHRPDQSQDHNKTHQSIPSS